VTKPFNGTAARKTGNGKKRECLKVKNTFNGENEFYKMRIRNTIEQVDIMGIRNIEIGFANSRFEVLLFSGSLCINSGGNNSQI
jgi:hypothetical protein